MMKIDKDEELKDLVYNYLGNQVHFYIPNYLEIEEVYIYKNGKRFNFTLNITKENE